MLPPLLSTCCRWHWLTTWFSGVWDHNPLSVHSVWSQHQVSFLPSPCICPPSPHSWGSPFCCLWNCFVSSFDTFLFYISSTDGWIKLEKELCVLKTCCSGLSQWWSQMWVFLSHFAVKPLLLKQDNKFSLSCGCFFLIFLDSFLDYSLPQLSL